jgi:hypothetical protein
MKRYILDMSKVAWWKGPKKIPLADGRFQMTFDVLENELDHEWIEQRRGFRKAFLHFITKDSWPMGVDYWALPREARIYQKPNQTVA